MFIIIIGGPTASGKSSFAIELAKALNTDIISADSMQIYRGLDIGTAKTLKTQGVAHHLIDIVEPDGDFSVNDYVQYADGIIKKLYSDGKIPIVCGGTAFYLDALIHSRSFSLAKKDNSLRDYYQNLLINCGAEQLYSLLIESDPETAARIHLNDTKRVIRALEILSASGISKSEIASIDSKLPNRYDYLGYCPDIDRQTLYDRINERVDSMYKQGLVLETQSLLNRGVSPGAQAMQAIGYKETLEYLSGKYSYEELKELVKKRSRNYAKRQMTFFKKFNMHRMKYDADGITKILSDIEVN